MCVYRNGMLPAQACFADFTNLKSIHHNPPIWSRLSRHVVTDIVWRFGRQGAGRYFIDISTLRRSQKMRTLKAGLMAAIAMATVGGAGVAHAQVLVPLYG